jgi:hypothetical protein
MVAYPKRESSGQEHRRQLLRPCGLRRLTRSHKFLIRGFHATYSSQLIHGRELFDQSFVFKTSPFCCYSV